ncbi:MAG: triose-phosphate isomerase [Candidatus Methanomethylophilaceae archaeon]
MRTPAVIINFKAYTEVDGFRSLDLARTCQKVADESGVCIAVCPPQVELGQVSKGVDIPVLSQHVDPRKPGSATGWVTPSMVAATGAKGSLLNHSEHRLLMTDIQDAVSMCRSHSLLTVVCTDSVASSAAAAAYRPDYVAVEPPELIGGDISVTEANPDVVRGAVDAVRRVDAGVRLLCGAGVKTGEDVRAALELGAEGVLLASGVVKSKDPYQSLLDLVKLI